MGREYFEFGLRGWLEGGSFLRLFDLDLGLAEGMARVHLVRIGVQRIYCQTAICERSGILGLKKKYKSGVRNNLIISIGRHHFWGRPRVWSEWDFVL